MTRFAVEKELGRCHQIRQMNPGEPLSALADGAAQAQLKGTDIATEIWNMEDFSLL